MRIMAIGTSYFAFGNRVVRKFVRLRPLLLVTGKTDVGLCLLVAYLVMCRVGDVAGGTGYIVHLVSAALPVCAFRVLFVTGQAGRILIFCLAWCVG